MTHPRSHWLDQPKNIRRLWHAFVVVLILTVLAEFVVPLHPTFAIERMFGFSAVFGFVACALMIVGAKVLGVLIKRPDTYYTTRDDADD